MLTSRQLLGAFAALTASLALFYPAGQSPHRSGGGESLVGSCPLGYGRRGNADARIPSPHVPGYTEPFAFPLARVFANATIWTGDATIPLAEAMAVTDAGRVMAIGTRASVVAAAGADAQVISLEGRHVIPGMQDAHLHLVSGGFRLTQLDLSKCTGKADFVEATRAAAQRMDADGGDASTWLLGGGWDESRWDPPSFPDASWIAEALADTKHPERPVWVLRADAHAGLASRSALAAANVDATAADPPGGSIGRVAGTTRPNGLIRENAIGLITAAIPEPSDARRIAAYHRAFRYLLSLGITSVSDFGDIDALAGSSRKGAAERLWHDFDILESLDDTGELPLRVSAYAPLADWERVRDHAKRGFFADGKNGKNGKNGDGSLSRFRVAGCKAFLDGSLGARTAWFQEPYEDDPGNAGEPVCDIDEYEARVVSADAAGLQIATHAIGDAAVAAAARAAERAASANGAVAEHHDGGAVRFRVEHAQHLPSPVDREARRLADVGALASVQPSHMLLDAFAASGRLGAKRARDGGYAFRSLVERGVPLAFGTDWPIVLDANPFATMRAAVTRHEANASVNASDAARPWDAAQALSARRALEAYTAGSARASGTAGLLGTLWRGAVADFVVLDKDPFGITSGTDLPRVMATYVDGACVFGEGRECARLGDV
jgi:predicted amidohydrolase YtcJ